MQHNDPQTKVLDLGDYFGKMLIRARDERIGDCAALGKGHDVAPQLTFDAFAAPWPGVDQAKFKPRHLGQGVMFCGAAAIGGLIPIATQHGQAGAVSSQAREQLQEPGMVPGDRVPATGAVNGHRAICERIACIDKQRTAIHATPSFPDARRYQRLAAFVTNSADHRPNGPVWRTA
jgi:hypothetical protein